MKSVLVITLVLLLTEMGSAQDPGIRDTVRFGDWGVYLPCPPCSGIATVPIYAYHDEYLRLIEFYLETNGPIKFSGVEFTSEMDDHFTGQQMTFAENRTAISLYNPNPPFPPPLPPGSRYMGYLILLLQDTGSAVIDTFRPAAPPNPPISFWTPEFELIAPSFFSSPFHLVSQNIKPGDSNGDGSTSLADIIYLVNYLFRAGDPPASKQMADANIDCSVNLEDLIFLVNYIFKAGPKPLPSWCNIN